MADVNTNSLSTTDKNRFATLTEDDHEKLLKEKDAKNTIKATNSAVRTFRAYLREKDICDNFETLPKAELNKMLSKFYTEARQENSEKYKKTSLVSIRHGMNRFLSSFSTDLIHDLEFKESNKTFAAVLKDLKREGLGGVTHYPPIEKEDLFRLYSYFDLNDKIKLQEKVFFDIMIYFGRRGRENIHELKISDFAATTDAAGRVYLYMTCDELTKNHQLDTDSSKGRMYSFPDDDMCPVKSFLRYKSHLNSKCDRLFQKPSKGHCKWYDASPLGHNMIGQMILDLSQKAGLSTRYCNHSIRATSVHVLDCHGKFAGRRIMSITGHKSEASLKTYTGYTGEQVKQSMSDTISKSLRSDSSEILPKPKRVCIRESENVCSYSELGIDPQTVTLQELTNSQQDALIKEFECDDSFDTVLEDIDYVLDKENAKVASVTVNNTPATQTAPTSNTMNISSNVFNSNRIPYPFYIKNCAHVTINYNISK